MTLAVVERLPVGNLLDVPAGLRKLADQIEAGEYGDVKQVAWVVRTARPYSPYPDIGVGLIGGAATVSAELHLLLGLAIGRVEHRVSPIGGDYFAAVRS